jgi:hypothetical protein
LSGVPLEVSLQILFAMGTSTLLLALLRRSHRSKEASSDKSQKVREMDRSTALTMETFSEFDQM